MAGLVRHLDDELAVSGDVIAEPGDEGEVLKVLREGDTGVSYHVRFPGHTLAVDERLLRAFGETGDE